MRLLKYGLNDTRACCRLNVHLVFSLALVLLCIYDLEDRSQTRDNVSDIISRPQISVITPFLERYLAFSNWAQASFWSQKWLVSLVC